MSDWILVYDEGTGWGHERRMRALGESLEARGGTVVLRPLGEAVSAPGIVVDSYLARADDRGSFDGERIVALDDLTRDLAVDLVVDPSPGAESRRHPRAARVLAGARYAVVDPGIRALGRRPADAEVASVLVTFGATDRAGAAAEVAEEIARELPDAGVDVPVGPWWEGPVPGRVRGVRCPDGLAPSLAEADLVVSAGGLTLLEALVLGRPTVAVVWAENQRLTVSHAASVDAVLPAERETAAGDCVALAGDPGRRLALAANARRLVDGMGADRVAAEVLGLAA